jgi:hypothetical protein
VPVGSVPPIIVSIAALCVSALALSLAALNYRRKAGILVRGSYSLVSSSRDTNDAYVNSLVLENLKDRAITIFEIYLVVGYNYYITLDDRESNPLVLKAFETYAATYGTVQFYGLNGKTIKLQNLLNNRRIKKRIVLSTSEGNTSCHRTFAGGAPLWTTFAIS